jgi:hypothetical protein
MSKKNNIFSNGIRRDAELLDRAMKMYFEPIAQKHNWPLVRIQDGIYEMPSPYFIQRIEAYAGHGNRDLSAMLRQTTLRAFKERTPGFQCDITWFMRFNDKNTEAFRFGIITDEDFLKMTQLFADAIEHFGVLYLLGKKNDFEAVMQFVQEQGKASVARIKQMQNDIERNMKNVRQEWPVVITRQKGDEWETVNELKATDIRFLGDLNGEKENLFKERLVEFFKSDHSVERAYLARIIGQNLPANGVLCLKRRLGYDKNIRRSIGGIFSDVFSIQDNFNIILLTEKQEAALSNNCHVFFVNT